MANTDKPVVGRAVLRDIRHTPQKARRVVDLVRGMRADEALSVLKFAPQAAGDDVTHFSTQLLQMQSSRTQQSVTLQSSGL